MSDERQPVLLFGHRGAPAERPENTLSSFRLALEVGANALETDVHLSRDGHVVVSHDPDGRRMADKPQEIARLTLDELAAWDVGFGFVAPGGARPFAGKGISLPSFDELLEEFPGVPINVDLKARDKRLAKRAVDVVKAHRAEERVLLASLDSDVLDWVRDAGFRGKTGSGQKELVMLVGVPARVLLRRPSLVKGDAVQVPTGHLGLRFDNSKFIELCHRLGKRVDFWTIDDASEARRLYGLGADGVMTNDPRSLVAAFEEARARRGG